MPGSPPPQLKSEVLIYLQITSGIFLGGVIKSVCVKQLELSKIGRVIIFIVLPGVSTGICSWSLQIGFQVNRNFTTF